MTVEARNAGQALVNAEVEEIVGPFEVEPTRFSLAVGDASELAIRMRPRSEGEIEGEIRFRAGDGTRVVLPVRGRGVDRALRVDPPRIDFGPVAVGERSTAEFKVESMADGDLDVLLSLGGSNEFQISTTPFVIGGRRSVTLEVTFVPQKRGTHAAWLDISPCTDCLPVRVDFTGVAVQADLVLVPPKLWFGIVPPGYSHRIEAELRNDGDAPIVVEELRLDAEDGAFEVEFDTPLPRELAPKESIPLAVRFDPGDFEAYQGELVVQAARMERRFEIDGRGGGPVLQGELLPIGPIPKGWAAPMEVTVRNVGEEGDVVFTSIEIADPERAFFVMDDRPRRVGDAEWAISVNAVGTVPGRPEATLRVHTELPFQPTIEIPLSVHVARPECELRFDPLGPIQLGMVDGKAPVTLELRVTHEGEGECLVWSPRFEDAKDAMTIVENPLSQGFHLVPPGETRTFRFESGALPATEDRRSVSTHFVLSHSEIGVDEELPISFLQANPLPFFPFQLTNFPDTPVGKESLVMVTARRRGIAVPAHPPFTIAEGQEEFEALPVNLGDTTPVIFRPTSPGRKTVLLESWWSGYDQPYYLRLEGNAVPSCGEPCDWPETTCSGEAHLLPGPSGSWFRQIVFEATPNPAELSCLWYSPNLGVSPLSPCTGGTVGVPWMIASTTIHQWVYDEDGRAGHCEISLDLPPLPTDD
jgi:hypothetical protein